MSDPSQPDSSDPRHSTLWAPWRIAYIRENIKNPVKQPKGSGCFLCDYFQSDNDCENFVLARTEYSMTVLNRFPYNNGHLLVAPHNHIGSLEELSDEQLFDCMKEVKRMTATLEKLVKPQGFNIGLNLGQVAGAGLPGHLHWHIVPRWSGDSNFMDVTGGTHVIPESLTSLYELMNEMLDC